MFVKSSCLLWAPAHFISCFVNHLNRASVKNFFLKSLCVEGEGHSKDIVERSVGDVQEMGDAHFSYISWYKQSAKLAQELFGFMEYLTGHKLTAKLSLRC